MKSFVFSLHALLDMKETVRDQLQAECTAAEAQLDRALNMMMCLERTWEAESEKYERKVRVGITPQDLETYSTYFAVLQEKVASAAQEVAQAQEAVSRKQTALVELFKEIKILEKLRQKQYCEYLADVEKHESSVQEDILSFQVTESVEK